ncbi:MAG: glycosyltransferase family 4 protein [Rhodospirillaceae bacterium]|jgi:glycosyltransferase involved in cell wall biosynthesis|nr:glycosyltransferase family 4 protein [Rhodospirillaceae bacterium]MBT4938892.1 glycosyltransferase family 4 protein [Rhodospirillaceae bacterium]
MGQNFLKSDRIRVLVNGIHAKSGGGVTYLRNILPLLAKDPELEIHLFLHRDQFELFGTLDERIRLHLLRFNNGFFANLIWEQCALPILARIMSVDVTVSPANFGPLFAPAQIIMLRNSLAVAGKETRPIKRLYWAGLTIMTALSLLTCRRAIAVSDYARKALTFGLGDKFQRKVTVVHHGVSEVFEANPNVERKNYLLAVSDIYVQKNIHTLIRALVKIRKKYPDIVLKIAGKAVDQGYLAELHSVLDQAQLRDAVEFLGEKNAEELKHLYQECKLFVFPSTVETFGNPLVEAMACAAPIVSSNTAAMPEVLGAAGYYFDPLDAQDMAESIIKLLEDDEIRRKLGEIAYQRAQLFSRKATTDKTAEVIKSVVPERYAQITSNQLQTSS